MSQYVALRLSYSRCKDRSPDMKNAADRHTPDGWSGTPRLRSKQTHAEIRLVRTRPQGLLVNSAATSLENLRLQRLLQHGNWDGRH